MNQKLPVLIYEDLAPTRDYLRDIALALGSLQRAFLKPHPRQWQHGLEVTMRGLATQQFMLHREPTRALLDLVKGKVRLGGSNWPLNEYSGAEIFKNIKIWLESHNIQAELEEPQFSSSSTFVDNQAMAYAEALWWFDEQFRHIRAGLKGGVTQPILLFPHHFDLSLVWFPWDDDRQLGLGWSTGDEVIPEPYIYLTAYPEPPNFTQQKLPPESYWQKTSFSGAILAYQQLSQSPHPQKLLAEFTNRVLQKSLFMI